MESLLHGKSVTKVASARKHPVLSMGFYRGDIATLICATFALNNAGLSHTLIKD